MARKKTPAPGRQAQTETKKTDGRQRIKLLTPSGKLVRAWRNADGSVTR